MEEGGALIGLANNGRLDHLDSQILMHLQRDGRSPYTALAALCGVSEGTIRKRMQRLESRGVVRIVDSPILLEREWTQQPSFG